MPNLFTLQLLALVGVAGALQAFAQGGSPDPVFLKFPIDQWIAAGERAQIPWKIGVSANQLSEHQRLRARATIQVDGRELIARRGKRELLMLVQFSDSDGRAYQSHDSLDLQNVTQGAGANYYICTHDAFIVPGEYGVLFGLVDTETREYSVARRTLRVAPLRDDPLPGAWRDMPPLEFFPTADLLNAPDQWFLPSVTGRLHIPLETRHPVRLQLLVNLPPTEARGSSPFTRDRGAARRGPGPMGRISTGRGRGVSPEESMLIPRRVTYEQKMGVLLPALKVVSEVEVRNGLLDIALLDITRRRISFAQEFGGASSSANPPGVPVLDWPRLKASLAGADRNLIDVESLRNRGRTAEFFSAEISRRLEIAAGAAGQQSADPSCALIVLSSPITFPPGEQTPSVSGTPGCRLFFIRYGSLSPYQSVDSLEQMLKPVKPRTFHVTTPMDFRKALGAVLREAASM